MKSAFALNSTRTVVKFRNASVGTGQADREGWGVNVCKTFSSTCVSITMLTRAWRWSRYRCPAVEVDLHFYVDQLAMVSSCNPNLWGCGGMTVHRYLMQPFPWCAYNFKVFRFPVGTYFPLLTSFFLHWDFIAGPSRSSDWRTDRRQPQRWGEGRWPRLS